MVRLVFPGWWVACSIRHKVTRVVRYTRWGSMRHLLGWAGYVEDAASSAGGADVKGIKDDPTSCPSGSVAGVDTVAQWLVTLAIYMAIGAAIVMVLLTSNVEVPLSSTTPGGVLGLCATNVANVPFQCDVGFEQSASSSRYRDQKDGNGGESTPLTQKDMAGWRKAFTTTAVMSAAAVIAAACVSNGVHKLWPSTVSFLGQKLSSPQPHLALVLASVLAYGPTPVAAGRWVFAAG